MQVATSSLRFTIFDLLISIQSKYCLFSCLNVKSRRANSICNLIAEVKVKSLKKNNDTASPIE